MKDMQDLNVRLGEYIKQGRRARHMTQETLAETVGLSANHISKIECGGSSVKFETIVRIFHTLGLSVDRFIVQYMADGTDTSEEGSYWKALRHARTYADRLHLKESINEAINGALSDAIDGAIDDAFDTMMEGMIYGRNLPAQTSPGPEAGERPAEETRRQSSASQEPGSRR